MELCPRCGRNLALVGRAHNCRPPAAPNATCALRRNAQPVTHEPADTRSKSAQRQARYRMKHLEAYRERNRERMRARRAAAKSNPST
jgi:hypothetical protein